MDSNSPLACTGTLGNASGRGSWRPFLNVRDAATIMGHAIALRSGPRRRTTLDITGPIQCKAPQTLPLWGWTSRRRASAQSLYTTRLWQVLTRSRAEMACQEKKKEPGTRMRSLRASLSRRWTNCCTLRMIGART
eukprot:2201265-Pyramimonas_sp.AAC.1